MDIYEDSAQLWFNFSMTLTHDLDPQWPKPLKTHFGPYLRNALAERHQI